MGGNASKSPANTQKAVTIADIDPNKPAAIEHQLSKQLLDFKDSIPDAGCPTHVSVFDEIDLKNVSNKKQKFKFEPVCPPTCQLTFTPASGTIEKGKSKKVKVKLVLLERANLNFKVTLRIEGGESLFINLRIVGESGVFGVDPNTLDQGDDNGYKVPQILIDMKNLIVKLNGLNHEGIFRLGGEQNEIKRIKELMNKKQYDFQTNDVNAIASLMKIWFRELPQPILNVIPQENIMGFQDANDCVQAFHSLPEPNKTLLSWLLDFLAAITSNSSVNKMSPQNIAIVVAPNLYDISTPNPMEGLILSQKCAAFLNHILVSSFAGT